MIAWVVMLVMGVLVFRAGILLRRVVDADDTMGRSITAWIVVGGALMTGMATVMLSVYFWEWLI